MVGGVDVVGEGDFADDGDDGAWKYGWGGEELIAHERMRALCADEERAVGLRRLAGAVNEVGGYARGGGGVMCEPAAVGDGDVLAEEVAEAFATDAQEMAGGGCREAAQLGDAFTGEGVEEGDGVERGGGRAVVDAGGANVAQVRGEEGGEVVKGPGACKQGDLMIGEGRYSIRATAQPCARPEMPESRSKSS